MSQVTDVLDSLGIPYALDGWEPKEPPKVPSYAVVTQVTRDDGSDFSVSFRRISAFVELYDIGTSACKKVRVLLHDALSDANLKHSMSSTLYFEKQKVFQTEYDLEDYIEKRSTQ